MSTDHEWTLHLAYVSFVDAADVAVVKIPSLTGQDGVTVYPLDNVGWTAPNPGDQLFVAVKEDTSEVRWLS